jgi:protein-S-isoprenylcysteine O-methyltransferase Ste14
MNISSKFIVLTILIIQFVLGRTQILLAQRRVIRGQIKAKWTSYLMSISRIGIIISSYVEFIYYNRNLNIIISSLGVGVFFLVLIVKQWAIYSLGGYWSRHIEIRQNQQLVIRGPYKFVRHPSYLMNILELLAIPLVANAWYTEIIAILAAVITYTPRIIIEEQSLLQSIGNSYQSYLNNVPCIIPFKILKVKKNGTC